jgi:hypothetical protein
MGSILAVPHLFPFRWRNNVARHWNNIASAIWRCNPSILGFIYRGETTSGRACIFFCAYVVFLLTRPQVVIIAALLILKIRI